ncbi:MAG: class I SAM-dependent methyltransferase [Sulfobacillus sp.]
MNLGTRGQAANRRKTRSIRPASDLPSTEAGSFDDSYFTKESTYSRFTDTVSARDALIRWYGGLFGFLDRFDGGQVNLSAPVLEVGCAHGAVLELLIRRGVRPIGSDISTYIIAQAMNIDHDSIFLATDVTQLAIRDGSLGSVIALEVLEHVNDASSALREIRRVLRPGGRLVATTPNPMADGLPYIDSSRDRTHVSVNPPRIWAELVSQVGFRDVDVLTVWQLPLLWRYSSLFSRTLRVPRIGPTCLILARV